MAEKKLNYFFLIIICILLLLQVFQFLVICKEIIEIVSQMINRKKARKGKREELQFF